MDRHHKAYGAAHESLRQFIDDGARVGLFEVRPVWLMNPDVASRVLTLGKGRFDAIIYDEALQMPVEYALPTLKNAPDAPDNSSDPRRFGG